MVTIPDDVTRQLYAGEEVVAVDSAMGVPASGMNLLGGPAEPIPFTYIVTNARFIDRTLNANGDPDCTSSWLGAEGLVIETVKRGFTRYELRWKHPIGFEACVSRVSKDFAKTVEALLSARSRWFTPLPESATWLGKAADGGTKQWAECSVCGGWLGRVLENGQPETRECLSCLRSITERA